MGNATTLIYIFLLSENIQFNSIQFIYSLYFIFIPIWFLFQWIFADEVFPSIAMIVIIDGSKPVITSYRL